MLEEIRDLGVTGLIQHQGLYAEADIKSSGNCCVMPNLRRLVLDFGAGIEHKSIHAVYGRGPLNTTTTPYAECDNPQVAAEFMATLLRIDAWMKKYAGRPFDWWYQGIDEPQCNGLMGLALWEYPLAKNRAEDQCHGVSHDATKQLASIVLDLAVSGSPANSATDNQKFLQLGEQLRLEYWFLGAGSYREQQGSIAANRLLSGWLFWQSAVPAHVSWTYSWSRNEFETGKPSWCMAYPRNNKAERIMDSSL